MSRKLSDTSMSAYKMVANDMRVNHWGKILFAMRLLGVPSSMEKIAERAGMELNQVTRRMNEIEREGLVHKEGKSKTKSGRACYLYVISRQSEVQNKINELTPQQIPTKKEPVTQPSLF